MKRGYKDLIDEAEAMIETLSGDAAEEHLGRDDVVFVGVAPRVGDLIQSIASAARSQNPSGSAIHSL